MLLLLCVVVVVKVVNVLARLLGRLLALGRKLLLALFDLCISLLAPFTDDGRFLLFLNVGAVSRVVVDAGAGNSSTRDGARGDGLLVIC